MLVLSRKKGESISLIQNDQVMAKIIVVETEGNRTRVGIDAPDEIRIMREELKEKEKTK